MNIPSVIAGYVLSSMVSGKREGERGILPSIEVPAGSVTIHLHHWIWASGLLGVMALRRKRSAVIKGLLIGIVIQGLTYKDRFDVVT